MDPIPLLAELPAGTPEELFETLRQGSGVRIERILSRGHSSPPGFWYDQAEEETVVVIAGAAELELADPEERVRLVAGDLFTLPAHRRHRVAWTDPSTTTVWLALFYAGG